MSKIALATAVVALTAAVPLMMGRAAAQQLVPAAAPPSNRAGATGAPINPTAAKPATAQSNRFPSLIGILRAEFEVRRKPLRYSERGGRISLQQSVADTQVALRANG